jgi:predicted acylesterase/phospholipase RssA
LGCAGLALSGGGLRAAFFHLGTLAFLAERHLLRYIDFISTVSGGTLTGTLYYLEVRALLGRKRDCDIRKSDYIDIVHRLIQHLLQGTRCNLRMRTFGDFGHAKSAIVKGEFNRSLRLGLLYNKYFYAKYFPDGGLTLHTAAAITNGRQVGNIRAYNLRRIAKIPELIVNTTSLNSGERFSFTPYWAGRRFSNRIGCEAFLESIELGTATAASSCVPGVFNAVPLANVLSQELRRNLYEWQQRRGEDGSDWNPRSPEHRARYLSLFRSKAARETFEYGPVLEEIETELVDGGVYDNQGLDALLEADCSLMICSDGAAPFLPARRASGGVGAVLRANGILMKRVGELIAEQVMLLMRSKGGVYIASLAHLPTAEGRGIDAQLASDIAKMRTDFDAFSETEAAVLMASGYAAAREGIPWSTEKSPVTLTESPLDAGQVISAEPPGATQEKWWFSPVLPYLRMPSEHNAIRRRIGRQISAAKYRFVRPFRLSVWHFLVVPTWLLGLLIMQWRLFDLQGALMRAGTGIRDWLFSIVTAFLFNPQVQEIGFIALILAMYIFRLGWMSGALDEPLSRVIEAVVIPSNLIRRVVAIGCNCCDDTYAFSMAFNF